MMPAPNPPFISPPEPWDGIERRAWSPPESARSDPERRGIGPEIDDPGAKGAISNPIDDRPGNDRVVVRCTPEFHAWVAGLADFMGVSLTVIVEQSLRVYAESRMFPILPPRRFVPSRRPRPGRKVH